MTDTAYILERFPYASLKNFERAQVEAAVKRVASACALYIADGGDPGDEEDCYDAIFDTLKPSEDEELFYLRVAAIYLSML